MPLYADEEVAGIAVDMLVAKRRARREFVSFYIAKDDRVSQVPGLAELFAANPVFFERV